MKRETFIAAAVAGLLAGVAGADTIDLGGGKVVTVELSSSSPGVSLDNVLLNGSITQTAVSPAAMLAHFNGEDADVATVRFTSPQTLTGSGGQAKFEANPVGTLLTQFTVTLDPTTDTYDAIQVDLNYANLDGGTKETGKVRVFGETTAGSFGGAGLLVFDIDSAGQGFVLGTTANTSFTSVTFLVTPDVAGGGLANVEQVRIHRDLGGVVPGPTVPVPAAAVSGIALMGGLAMARVRGRR